MADFIAISQGAELMLLLKVAPVGIGIALTPSGPVIFSGNTMEHGQIIYVWKLVYWQAIGEGKEPQRAAAIANQHVAAQRHSLCR